MANKHSNVETRTVQRIAFNVAGQRASTWNASGNLVTENYYADGQAVAYYSSTDGYIHFQHQDWEGTVRVRTKYNAAVDGTFLSYPFGDGFTESGSDSDPLHYALLDHDADSYTEHATFRQYSSTQGRWLAPDPFGGSYDAGNPQSLNRYVYVLNNPLSFIDPLGLNSVAAGCIDADGSRTSDTPASSCEGGEDSGETGVSQVVPDCTGPGCPHDPAPPPPPPAPGSTAGPMAPLTHFWWNTPGALAMGQSSGPGGRTGAAPQQLNYRTVRGGPGEGKWETQWELSEASSEPGVIVQQVWRYKDKNRTKLLDTWWEAWFVPANSRVTSNRIFLAPFDDEQKDISGRRGDLKAIYYPGLTLQNLVDSGFKSPNPQVLGAGLLYATHQDPNLPTNNATAPVWRTWTAP